MSLWKRTYILCSSSVLRHLHCQFITIITIIFLFISISITTTTILIINTSDVTTTITTAILILLLLLLIISTIPNNILITIYIVITTSIFLGRTFFLIYQSFVKVSISSAEHLNVIFINIYLEYKYKPHVSNTKPETQEQSEGIY